MEKLKAGIIGATGMVGQRFLTLLAHHPYFEIAALAAGPRSAGKPYAEAVAGRWKLNEEIPGQVRTMPVLPAEDIARVAAAADFVFCAVNMEKAATLALEEAYAGAGVPVVSNNSANRHTPDVPMIIPEINPEHLDVISAQKKRLGTETGFIVVKPNCSIQSYVGALAPLRKYGIKAVLATTCQAISGAGRTFREWPEMVDNLIPYIAGEEEKSEQEPLKVFGRVENGRIVPAAEPLITTQCLRVPVTDGHTASVFVSFAHKPAKEQILADWAAYRGEPQTLGLPSAPEHFLTYFEEPDRPQAGRDRDLYGGMGISLGRLREDTLFDYKFIGLSHNTLRGAAGGAVLIAELLFRKGYLVHRV